ncbi:uncharacterized protein DNG_07048 [Cephalotrichum gorgonifer]|uniref:Pathogen-related protein n=1 Tax=Cephalotrichum gorgonifer TaxID=2041049 RepID=A0AAE8SX37_9PEZI|nr:uncharacterized protein DNG_07048 [Cephalotrichum gorgonifer]
MTEQPETPALPDVVLNPDAVLGDSEAAWRYGRAPDYSKTRKFYAEGKSMNHEAGSLPSLVENLVKNWEIEASYKTSVDDWRTVDPSCYTLSLNGGPKQPASHMLNVGTYNALIPSNQYYDPEKSTFDSSHKSFKRMMPTFAWEVLEVYSGPPTVAFKWRHWGNMVNDYVGYNSKGEKVTVKAHGGVIDIQGIVVAKVNEGLKIESIDVWYDPMEMFRQIDKEGTMSIGPAAESEGASLGSGCPVAH